MTPRQQLIRDVRRCLADLEGGQAWRYSLHILRYASVQILAARQRELHSDEIAKLEVLAEEYRAWERQCWARP